MGITPIEMCTMFPKSQEASTLKQNESNRTMSHQNNVVNQINQEVRRDSMMTVRTSETAKSEYRYDAKEKGNGSYNGNQEGRKRKEDKKEKLDEIKLSSFDVRI